MSFLGFNSFESLKNLPTFFALNWPKQKKGVVRVIISTALRVQFPSPAFKMNHGLLEIIVFCSLGSFLDSIAAKIGRRISSFSSFSLA
jgi:hypothetical protein